MHPPPPLDALDRLPSPPRGQTPTLHGDRRVCNDGWPLGRSGSRAPAAPAPRTALFRWDELKPKDINIYKTREDIKEKGILFVKSSRTDFDGLKQRAEQVVQQTKYFQMPEPNFTVVDVCPAVLTHAHGHAPERGQGDGAGVRGQGRAVVEQQWPPLHAHPTVPLAPFRV